VAESCSTPCEPRNCISLQCGSAITGLAAGWMDWAASGESPGAVHGVPALEFPDGIGDAYSRPGEEHGLFFSAESTRDQQELELRKSEHEETGDMPLHLSYSAAGRPSRMTDKALRENFHLPLSEVAKRFNMCTTAFKKLCRKQGIMHWPHRALRSIEKKIASLRAEAKFTNDQYSIEKQISELQHKRDTILSGIGLPTGMDDEMEEITSGTGSRCSTARSFSPSLDGSSTATTLGEDSRGLSGEGQRRVNSMHDMREYERQSLEKDAAGQYRAQHGLQRRSASFDSMVRQQPCLPLQHS